MTFVTEELVAFIRDDIDVTPAKDDFDWGVWEQKQEAVIAFLTNHTQELAERDAEIAVLKAKLKGARALALIQFSNEKAKEDKAVDAQITELHAEIERLNGLLQAAHLEVSLLNSTQVEMDKAQDALHAANVQLRDEIERLRAPAGDVKGADMSDSEINLLQARSSFLHGSGALTFDDLIKISLYPLMHKHDPWTEDTLEKLWSRQYPYCLFVNGRRYRVPFSHLIGSQIVQMASDANRQLFDASDVPISLNALVDLTVGEEPLHFFTVPPCRP
jgi:hypothetical protein